MFTPLIGTEIEYAPHGTGIAATGPLFWSAAIVSAYLGLGPTADGEKFNEEWLANYSTRRGAEPTTRVSGVVSVAIPGSPSAFLANGGRMYVDHAHPEYSTPECSGPLEAAHHELAGDQMMVEAAHLATNHLQDSYPSSEMRMFKSNSDGKGHSWGAHENYLLPRRIPFAQIVDHLSGFFITRQIYCGAGKIGSENGRPDPGYQLTQRADFFTRLTSLQTTVDRGIINTRDEPHADPEKYRRLHVICGDANLSPYALWLKLATTSLVMYTLGRLDPSVDMTWAQIENPVDAVLDVSHDLEMRRRYKTADGQMNTAVDISEQYLQLVSRTVERYGGPEGADEVLTHWSRTLDDLRQDPEQTSDRLDWAAKLRVLEDAGIPLDDTKAKAVDFLYHELGGDSLTERLLKSGTLILPPGYSQSRIDEAKTTPPETRAALRAGAISADPGAWEQIDWSYGQLRDGTRVPFDLEWETAEVYKAHTGSSTIPRR